MTYTVKEIFYTLQGEGAQAGRAAVFCRFAGCNLWTGREADRASAVCTFCDTDFVGVGPEGGKFATPGALAAAVDAAWGGDRGEDEERDAEVSTTLDAPSSSRSPRRSKLVVCTGGEPLLQLDAAAVDAFHVRGFDVAVETNGTQPLPPGIDWLCVSPKAAAPLAVTAGDELKLVYPQLAAPPERFESLHFKHFFLQPMDGPDLAEHTRRTIAYCLAHPRWRLSVQTHKIVGIR